MITHTHTHTHTHIHTNIYFWVYSVNLSGPTFCDPLDYSLPGSSVHWLSQARILEWVSISYSRETSWSRPRDWTRISCISCISRHILYHWATREALYVCMHTRIKVKVKSLSHVRLFAKINIYIYTWASQMVLVAKNPPAHAGNM